LSPARSEHVLESLAREAGASEILLAHLAVEEAYTDAPLVMGNRAQLLRDGDETFREMERALGDARHHINVEVYIFHDDELGRRIADLMMSKAREGVAVNLIYDSVGSIDTDERFFDELRRAGVHVVEYNPVDPTKARRSWQLEQRDHRKLLVVDDRVAFTGGLNFSNEYAGSSPRASRFSSGRFFTKSATMRTWRDTHVEIEGPVVQEFQKLFRKTWEKQHGDRLPWNEYFAPAAPAGNQIVRAIGSTPDDSFSLIHTTMLSAIEHAQRSIHLTQAYFVPDDELVEALIRAARRGVDTQIVLPGVTDFWMTRFAGRARFSDLLDAGVRLHERLGSVLHAKTAVIDGVWSTVGSANLDYRSLVKNDEINAVILGEQFADQLEAMFRDDVAASREITKTHWKRRGISTRVKETVARVWKRWL